MCPARLLTDVKEASKRQCAMALRIKHKPFAHETISACPALCALLPLQLQAPSVLESNSPTAHYGLCLVATASESDQVCAYSAKLYPTQPVRCKLRQQILLTSPLRPCMPRRHCNLAPRTPMQMCTPSQGCLGRLCCSKPPPAAPRSHVMRVHAFALYCRHDRVIFATARAGPAPAHACLRT